MYLLLKSIEHGGFPIAMSLHHNHPAPGLEQSQPPHGFNHVWATHSIYRSLEYMIALISWQPSCHQAIMTWKPVEKEWIHKVWGLLRLTKKHITWKKPKIGIVLGNLRGGFPYESKVFYVFLLTSGEVLKYLCVKDWDLSNFNGRHMKESKASMASLKNDKQRHQFSC